MKRNQEKFCVQATLSMKIFVSNKMFILNLHNKKNVVVCLYFQMNIVEYSKNILEIIIRDHGLQIYLSRP